MSEDGEDEWGDGSEDGEDDAGDASDPLEDALGEEDGGDGNRPGEEGDPEREDPVDAFVEDVTERPDEAGEDPFERMGAGPVPEGDPFERLEGDADGEPTATPSDSEHDMPGADSSDGPSANESPEVERSSDPFGGFDSTEGDPFGEGESVFERVDVGTVDPDGVWDSMDGEDAEEIEGEGPAVEEVPGRRYVEVSKHSYCERCEYFSGPPEVSCSHEGTQILEFTDMETVRLVDCPVVAERQALEDEG